MKNIIKKLLREGLTEETEKYTQKIENIVNKIINSEDTLEPISINDKYSFKKENNKISIITDNGVRTFDDVKDLKRYFLVRYFEDNKGQNIKLSNYKTEKIKGNELKIGDIYVRTHDGARFIYKILSNFRPYRNNPNFFDVDVEVMGVGNQIKHVSNNPDGTYEIIGKNIGDNIIDTFKNKFGISMSNKIEFGDVIKILNF